MRHPRVVGLSVDGNEAAAGRTGPTCQTSNLAPGVYRSIQEHPVDRLRRAGVRISLNTDDPSLLGASLEGEYALCSGAYDWSTEELRAIAGTSIDASFASENVKRSLHDALQRW